VDLVCCLEVYSEDVVPGSLLGEEASQPVEEDPEYTWVHEKVRDSDEREDGEGGCSDVAKIKDNVEEDEAHDEMEQEQEEKEQEHDEIRENEQMDEEDIIVQTKPSRRRRQVIVSDGEDSSSALDCNSGLVADLQQTQKAVVVDDPQPLAPGARNQTIDIRAQDMPHVPGESLSSAALVCATTIYIDIEKPTKKEKETPPAHRVRASSVAGSSQEGRAPFGTHKPLGSTPPSLSSDILRDSIRPTYQTRAKFEFCRANGVPASSDSGMYVVCTIIHLCHDCS
jgi:hypothetical protein